MLNLNYHEVKQIAVTSYELFTYRIKMYYSQYYCLSLQEGLPLREFTDLPATVKVCRGTYTTCSGQKINIDNCNLYVHERISRQVVQIKCEYLKQRLVYINLPLSSGIFIGFQQTPATSTNNIILNVKQLKHEKVLPKLLYIKTQCHCRNHSTQDQSNVLMILALNNKKLLVRNVSTQKTYELSQRCDATLSTDPKEACASAKNLQFLPHDSLPWANIETTQPLDSSESPIRSLNTPVMTIQTFITEECFKVQIESGDFHLVPVDNELVVMQDDTIKTFPQSIYEELDNIFNQPTRREYPQHEHLPLSPSGSFVSGASSRTSASSFEGLRRSSFPIIISKRKLLCNNCDIVLQNMVEC